VEFYGAQRLLATGALRLVRVTIARAGFGFSVGFPPRLRQAYIARAVRVGCTVVEVREPRNIGVVPIATLLHVASAPVVSVFM
jgi:hypothetical protein